MPITTEEQSDEQDDDDHPTRVRISLFSFLTQTQDNPVRSPHCGQPFHKPPSCPGFPNSPQAYRGVLHLSQR